MTEIIPILHLKAFYLNFNYIFSLITKFHCIWIGLYWTFTINKTLGPKYHYQGKKVQRIQIFYQNLKIKIPQKVLRTQNPRGLFIVKVQYNPIQIQ